MRPRHESLTNLLARLPAAPLRASIAERGLARARGAAPASGLPCSAGPRIVLPTRVVPALLASAGLVYAADAWSKIAFVFGG